MKIPKNFPTKKDYEGLSVHTLRSENRHCDSEKSNRPLVSIITATMNSEKTIERSILNIWNQTYKNIEYIIIDGKSNDSTLEIVKKHKDKVDKYICENDFGIADAYNKGISISSGEIIGILNSDDWYNLDTIEVIVDNYLKYGKNIYYGQLKFFREVNKGYKIIDSKHQKLLTENSVMHPSIFIPREFYEKGGLFSLDYKIAMDYDLMLRFYQLGFPYFYINSSLTNMIGGGISDKNWYFGFKECRRIRKAFKCNPLLNNFEFLKITIKTIISRIRWKIFPRDLLKENRREAQNANKHETKKYYSF